MVNFHEEMFQTVYITKHLFFEGVGEFDFSIKTYKIKTSDDPLFENSLKEKRFHLSIDGFLMRTLKEEKSFRYAVSNLNSGLLSVINNIVNLSNSKGLKECILFSLRREAIKGIAKVQDELIKYHYSNNLPEFNRFFKHMSFLAKSTYAAFQGGFFKMLNKHEKSCLNFGLKIKRKPFLLFYLIHLMKLKLK